MFWLICFVLVIIIIIAIARLFLMGWRDAIMFSPTRQTVYNPKGSVVNFMIDCKAGEMHAQYHAYSSSREDGVLVFYHGTNANLSCRKYVMDMASAVKMNLLLIDYAGYGMTPGYPSLEAIAESGKASIRWLKQYGYHEKNIRVWAESIGSVAAAHVVKEYKCHSLVVLFGVASFQSILSCSDSKIAQTAAKFSSYLLPRDTNEQCYERTKTKMILLHSKEDDIIPYKSIIDMVKSIPKKYYGGLITIKGGHSSPVIAPEQMLQVLKFADITPPDEALLTNWLSGMSTVVNEMQFRLNDVNLMSRPA